MYPYSDPTSGQSRYQPTSAEDLLIKGQQYGFGGWILFKGVGYGAKKIANRLPEKFITQYPDASMYNKFRAPKGATKGIRKKLKRKYLSSKKLWKKSATQVAARTGVRHWATQTVKWASKLAKVALPIANTLLAAELAIGIPVALGSAVNAAGRKQLLSATPQFHDLQEAYTERQRGVQALHNSSMNARSVIGKEASLMHK